jgi:hypothetical protein
LKIEKSAIAAFHNLGSLPHDCLVRMYLRHYEELIAYFNGRKHLLLVNLSDPEIGDKLAAFIGVEPREFPRLDAVPRLLWRRSR